MNLRRILIVEDEAIVAMDIEERLSRLGYESAGHASSAEEAVAMTGQRHPDLVLMDIRLRGDMDGIATAEEIHRQYRTPVIFLTAYAEDDTLERAKRSKSFNYILKPCQDSELKVAIEIALYKHAAEEEIREREARYRAVVETSPDGFWMTDMEGHLLEVNDAYVQRSGYRREELLTMRVSDLEATESPADIKAHIEAIRRGGHDIFEMQHRTKDGTVWLVEAAATYWPIAEGRMFVFLRDIARRKRAEFLLQTRMELTDTVRSASLDRLLQAALDRAELLTGSCIGFFHFVDPDQEHLTLQAWSTNTVNNMCTAAGKGQHYPISEAGVWVDCVATRQPVIHNDYASLPHKGVQPDGHAPVVRELVVPVIRNGLVTAIMGVGNKTTHYEAEDVEAVEAVATMIADLVLRKKTQEELEHFFQLVPDMVCIVSWDGHFQRLNPEWERVLGYTQAELLAAPFLEFVHPDDRSATVAEFQREKRGDRTARFVNRYRAKDGSYRWLEWDSTSMTGECLVFGVARDITERRNAEIALRKSRERYRALFDRSLDCVFISDFEGNFLDANHAALDLLGYRREEILRISFASLLSDDQLPLAYQVVQEVMANGHQKEKTEYRLRRKDGSHVDVETQSSLVYGEGQPQAIQGIARDITKRKEDTNRLRAAADHWQATFDAVDDAIVLLDTDCRIERSNRAMQQMLGVAGDDLVGKHCWEAVHGGSQPLPECPTERMRQTLRRETADFQVGDRCLNVTVDPVLGANDQYMGAVLIIHDVTERIRFEESQRRSEKLNALGTLAGGVAHDFNNILLAINGNAELAAIDLPPNHPSQESLQQISASCARAKDLVRQILGFSRPSEPTRTTVSPRHLVEEVVRLLRSTLPTTVELRTDFATDLPAILADATQVHQVLVNLAMNAAHAIGPRPGYVAFRLDMAAIAEGTGSGSPELRPGRYVRLSIQDDGCGMDSTVLDRIFDPFFTSKPHGQGTGLGLSVVHGIVKSHDGGIAVESQLGQGTTFHVYFPAAEQTAAVETTSPPQAALGDGARVLYIDDEKSLVVLAQRFLTRAGYTVTGHTDAERALEEFRERPDDFDVVVTDLAMPRMSGFDLTRHLLDCRPDLPIILTSGYMQPEDEVQARELGIHEVIIKPDTISRLRQVLTDLFGVNA